MQNSDLQGAKIAPDSIVAIVSLNSVEPDAEELRDGGHLCTLITRLHSITLAHRHHCLHLVRINSIEWSCCNILTRGLFFTEIFRVLEGTRVRDFCLSADPSVRGV